MALRQFSSRAVSSLGLRVQALGQNQGSFNFAQTAGAMAARAYGTVLEGYKYQKSHEWAKVDGETATVGISDHAQSELGDVVYVELPEVGRNLNKGEAFGVVESVKAASDVYAPISGEVVEVNQELSDKPSTVNSDPFKTGWIMKVKVANPQEMDALMDAAAYKAETQQ